MQTSPDAPPPGPTSFHRLALLRPEWGPWWRPLLVIATALLAFTVLASLLMVSTVLVLALAGAPRGIGQVLGDPRSPLDVFLQLAFAVLLIPSVLLAVRLGGWRPTGLLLSVAGRFRGDLLRVSAPVVLTGFAALSVILLLLGGVDVPAGTGGGTLAAVIALVLALSPLQALGEELAFRGLAQQAVGTWLRSPVWAILLPVPCELIGRGYDARGLAVATTVGLACGFLAWKSGGLELPVLLHLAVLGPRELTAALGAPGAVATSASVVTVLAVLAAAWGLTVWLSRREGLGLLEPLRRPAGRAPAAIRF